jgi:hypothetical protein
MTDTPVTSAHYTIGREVVPQPYAHSGQTQYHLEIAGLLRGKQKDARLRVGERRDREIPSLLVRTEIGRLQRHLYLGWLGFSGLRVEREADLHRCALQPRRVESRM